MSLVIIMANDCLRIGLAVVEHHTSHYLYLRTIPLTIQILLLRHNLIQKLVGDKNLEEWVRLIQFIFYANLTVDASLPAFSCLTPGSFS